jgi:nitrous oxidase accessory protein
MLISGLSTCWAKILTVGDNNGYAGLAQAIANAKAYDTILIHEGIYVEDSVIIRLPLTITGLNYPVIENRLKKEIITVFSNEVVLEGLLLRNVDPGYIKDNAGIRLVRSKNCIVRNNKLMNTFFGIYLQNSSSCTVIKNFIQGNAMHEMSSGNAIHLWYCDSLIITGNDLLDHRDGIYLEFVSHSTITNNLSNGNLRYGMHFMFSHFNLYSGNTFRNNGTGVAVMYSDHIIMEHNEFSDNWGSASFGILLKDIKDSKIIHNTFGNNTTAIHMDNSLRIHFEHNLVYGNGWGIRILGNCSENLFTANDFIDNNFDISTSGKHSENVFNGNYWRKYRGYDLDKDGTGDEAYNPVTLSSFIVTKYPVALILIRSIFLDMLDIVETTAPVFIPTDLTDQNPLMKASL